MEAIPTLKILLVGESGVGKTCITNAFEKDGAFDDTVAPTVFLALKYRVVTAADGQQYKITMWDTAGQERFGALNRAFYRRAHAALIVYDITSRASFDRVAHWVAEITDHCAGAEEAVLMLVGNKLDRADERAVSFAEGAAMARAHDMLYIETSARSYAGVRQAFDEVLQKIIDSGVIEAHATAQGSGSGAKGEPAAAVDVTAGATAGNGNEGYYCC